MEIGRMSNEGYNGFILGHSWVILGLSEAFKSLGVGGDW